MSLYDILIIDDEADICQILGKVLKAAGYNVQTKQSAREAEEFLKTQAPPLIFCDISMPEKSGLELLQDIRFSNYASAVVMLTAHSEKERIIEALRLGAMDYLVKPFDTEFLLRSIPVWIQMGERLAVLAEDQENNTGLKRLNYMRVINNLDRKKTG